MRSYDGDELTFDVDKGAAEVAEEVPEPRERMTVERR